ncbi:MAG: ABC transporter permease [Cyanobacteria bacterium P01_H01_bin.74]
MSTFLSLALRKLLDFLAVFGHVVNNVGNTSRFIWRAAGNTQAIVEQTARIGFDSLGMSILICITAGAILSMQTAERFSQTGADGYIGGMVALALVREIVPIFTCLAVGARSGTAIAAELANMRVTEQIDALVVMHVNPIRYLMLPRVIGAMIALPLLTILGEVASILTGMGVSQVVAGLHYHKFLESVWLMLKPYDIRVSLLKAVIFGLILAAISCTLGLNTKGGARDVGLSTTRSVIWISVVIIVTDFFFSWVFFSASYAP